jgi:hypothetical protein
VIDCGLMNLLGLMEMVGGGLVDLFRLVEMVGRLLMRLLGIAEMLDGHGMSQARLAFVVDQVAGRVSMARHGRKRLGPGVTPGPGALHDRVE